ncbi:TPA: hypothetical protein ACN36H_003134 [Vibrio parahaemolyticus]
MSSKLMILIIFILSFSSIVRASEGSLDCNSSLRNIEVDARISADISSLLTLITEQRMKLCQSFDKNRKPDIFKRSEAITGLAKGLPGAVEKYLFSVFPQDSKTPSLALIKELTNAAVQYSDYLKDDPYNDFAQTTFRLKQNSLVFKFGSKEDFGVIFSNRDCKNMLIPGEQTKRTDGLSCRVVMESLTDVINAFREPIEDIAYEKANAEINATLQKWQRFNDNARAMTLLDSIATYQLQGGYYKQVGNDGPADLQFFFLHPAVLYEHIPNAVKGDRTEFSLGLEVFGVNCWDCFEGKFPIGASATALYTDRPNVSEFGIGVGVHLFNHYTIGYTYRDEGSGIYIDINLTEWLTEKNAHLERGLQTLVDNDLISIKQAGLFGD